MNMNKENRHMNIVIVGHVDHGKSTVIGRLLADTNSLPEGKLESVKEKCRKNSKPFEYAFLLDALKDEQAQGITIDSARCFFKSKARDYIIIDAPGHIEFLRNMVTGASRAEAALLVIDAKEGIKENSKRHGYLLSMLGITQIVVLVNKMDLVGYDEVVYQQIVKEYSAFLASINLKSIAFIPISAFNGDNLIDSSIQMSWYGGCDVLQTLDKLEVKQSIERQPFRMPVQGVYKFTNNGDDRRIIAGTIESGTISVGDEITFYPSGKQTRVKTIEGFNEEEVTTKNEGQSIGFTTEEQLYIKRGEMVVKADESIIHSGISFKANVFWLGKQPLILNKTYIFKIGSASVKGHIERIVRVLDASNLSTSIKNEVHQHEVAEIIVVTNDSIAYDLTHELPKTSRFVIVDDYEISGGGIVIEEVVGFDHGEVAHTIHKNTFWQRSYIRRQERIERHSQLPVWILIAGEAHVGKKPLAKALENYLFQQGRLVYFLSTGNVKHGLSNIYPEQERHTHVQMLTEVANILLDSGHITISTATNLDKDNYHTIHNIIDGHRVIRVWLGDNPFNMEIDILLKPEDTNYNVQKIVNYLKNNGVMYKGEFDAV
ncbi:MAG: adenylyl-sulfate kinase [Firmicutes bacterium HGW-Firmicutes-2]|jgi:bifunctional enzyme CysN/CysC|nr:MAG: adenylyl-sulfate kinase [Firmicutes bacterium HGW-Firmicutes-2]